MLKIIEYVAVASTALVVVCLFVLTIAYSSQPPNDPKQHQNTEEAKPRENNSEEQKTFGQKVARDPLAVFTLFLVLFTMVLAAVGVVQIKLVLRAETVAEITANAAKKAANVAEKALVDVERPVLFVNVTEPGILPISGEPHIPFVMVTIKNIGRQPAIIDFSIAEILFPDTLQVPITEVPIPGVTAFDINLCHLLHDLQPLAAGESLSVKCQRASLITPEQVANISGIGPIGQRVFFFGVIRYHDPLGIGRVNGFCMRFIEPSDTSPRGYFIYTDLTSNYDRKT